MQVLYPAVFLLRRCDSLSLDSGLTPHRDVRWLYPAAPGRKMLCRFGAATRLPVMVRSVHAMWAVPFEDSQLLEARSFPPAETTSGLQLSRIQRQCAVCPVRSRRPSNLSSTDMLRA